MPKRDANCTAKTAFLFQAFFVFALCLAPLAVVADCFVRSPLTPPNVDPHTAIEPNRLNNAQREAVETLFRSLRGRWQGKAVGYFCEGTETSPRHVPDNATVELDIESYDPGSVTLNAVLTANDRRSRRNEQLRLFLSNETLRVDRDTRAGETRVLSATRNQLAFAVKEAHGRGGLAGGFLEVHRNIRISRNQLTIEFIVYSQGGLSSTSRWNARRR